MVLWNVNKNSSSAWTVRGNRFKLQCGKFVRAAPEARIMPLDQAANDAATISCCGKYITTNLMMAMMMVAMIMTDDDDDE